MIVQQRIDIAMPCLMDQLARHVPTVSTLCTAVQQDQSRHYHTQAMESCLGSACDTRLAVLPANWNISSVERSLERLYLSTSRPAAIWLVAGRRTPKRSATNRPVDYRVTLQAAGHAKNFSEPFLRLRVAVT
jgi:hypothetical protein